MKQKQILIIAGTAILSLAAGFFAGKSLGKSAFPQEPKDPADALADARAAYDYFLEERAETQWDMTIASGEMYKLAEMEILWLEDRVQALPVFPKIFGDYQESANAWFVKFKKEMSRASDYEGGSMESTDMALRGISLMKERIANLRELCSRASSKH